MEDRWNEDVKGSALIAELQLNYFSVSDNKVYISVDVFSRYAREVSSFLYQSRPYVSQFPLDSYS